MTKLTVVIVNDDSVARGGTAVLALMSAKALKARGHEVIWLCGDAGDAPELTNLGIEVIADGGRPILQQPRLKALVSGVHNTRAAQHVARFIETRDTPATVYHVHSWAQILSPSIFGPLTRVASRTLLHAHDMFLACPNGVYMDYRHDSVCDRVPLSMSCVTTNCDKRNYAQKLWRVSRTHNLFRHLGTLDGWGGILAIHPATTPKLARAGYPDAKIFPVRNPVVPFTPRRIEAENNSALLYVGRLEKDKGIVELVEAAARVDVPLIVVGDGPLRETLRKMVTNVQFVGWVDKSGIAEFASQARALVMPSRHPEPFGLVLAEAAASGLPVLTSKTAAMADEVSEAGLGFAFDVFDARSFDTALQTIMNLSSEKVRQMSERGFSQQPALGNDPEGWIDALEAEYDRVLATVKP